MSAVYGEAGVSFPEIVPEPGWNEFDLTDVYRALAPQLCAEDPEFARQYQELVAQARAAAEQPDASVNRRWLPCDVKVVEAWIARPACLRWRILAGVSRACASDAD